MSEGQKVMVELGGLWWSKTKDGRAYLSGRLGAARLVILPNRGKAEGDRRPDFLVFVAPPVDRGEGVTPEAAAEVRPGIDGGGRERRT